MSFTLSKDYAFKTTIDKAWSALTDSKKLEKWITSNDFQPVVGHAFQFRMPGNEWWDGIIKGEVLSVDKPKSLSYTFGTGDEVHTVTWTLSEVGDGTVNLHLEQTGIQTKEGLKGAEYGWAEWFEKFTDALEQ